MLNDVDMVYYMNYMMTTTYIFGGKFKIIRYP